MMLTEWLLWYNYLFVLCAETTFLEYTQSAKKYIHILGKKKNLYEGISLVYAFKSITVVVFQDWFGFK